jgi:hypothetical protein
MAKHLGHLNLDEWRTLHSSIVNWLKKHDVAGSVAQDYSLYDALDREWEKAKRAVAKSRRS